MNIAELCCRLASSLKMWKLGGELKVNPVLGKGSTIQPLPGSSTGDILFGSNIILNSNKFHLHSSGKRKGVIRNKTCSAVKISKEDVNTKHLSRVIFICIAYLLSSYTLLKTGMKSMS
ncbi:hypothetical protein EK904_000845 [Melospiza melodia maxima]|nr:hypothetical protein EK904_000845 [Melospiza melodia maxima]